MRDIAKAQKHVYLNHGRPEVSTAAQVSTQSLGWDVARWDEAYWDSPPQVVVKTNADDYRAVEKLVISSLEILENEMKRLGV